MGKLSITPLTPAIGALIDGIDTADVAMLDAHGAQLRQALLEHQVIFFRDQRLDPAAHVRLASVFGTVNDVSSTFAHHPDNAQVELLESQGRGPGTDVWHADLTWQRTPPLGACLYAVDVPAAGGDTMWASMTAAYDSLAPKMQAYVSELRAIHSWEGPEVIGNVLARADGEARYRRMRETYPPLEVPVVAIHPETKKPVLTVNALYTTSICGVTREESAALITLLAGLARVPEWQVRFHWTPGAVAIWDNRAVQHYAVNDYYPSYRLMHRVTIGAPSEKSLTAAARLDSTSAPSVISSSCRHPELVEGPPRSSHPPGASANSPERTDRF